MKKMAILFYILFFAYYLNAHNIKYGESYQYPSEFGNFVLYEDFYIQDQKKIPSTLVQEKQYLKLISKDTTYFVFSCEVNELKFISLLKEAKLNYDGMGNWEIPYSFDEGAPLREIPALTGFIVKGVSACVSEKNKHSEVINYCPVISYMGDIPWAVNKNEKEKKIYLKLRFSQQTYLVDKIVIANGFISCGKSYLYEENARAKNIKIDVGNKSSFITLEDTPNFQVIPIPQELGYKNENSIEIEILDYYEGTKYSDIVISGIYYVDANYKNF